MEFSTIDKINYPEIAKVYQEGIDTGFATFETKAPNWESWDNAHIQHSRISCYENSTLLGWGALSPVSSRCVYGGVAEVSVYISAAARGKGIGTHILNKLIDESEKNNIWTLQSGVFRENKASIAIHEKCGFRIIGYKERIGKLHGVWKDNILLERRSEIVGL